MLARMFFSRGGCQKLANGSDQSIANESGDFVPISPAD